nr:hypothetical protein [Tanacetum cinerariifolium]
MALQQNVACHQSEVHPMERLMVRRYDTSLSWTRETYYELCTAFQEDRACLRVYLNIPMIHCLQEVLDLEKTTTTQRNEIASLKRRIKKLEKKNSLGEDASKKERRINAIDAEEDITLVNDADKEMFDVDVLGGEEMFVAWKNENVVKEVVDAAQVSTTATTVTITNEEITLAQALKALKTSKPKVKGIVFQELG